MNTTRRQFIFRSLSIPLAAGAAVSFKAAHPTELGGSPETAGLLPMIDTHQHLWDWGGLHPASLKSGNPLARDFLTKEYLEATENVHVVKAVYMEVDFEKEKLNEEADCIIKLCKQQDNPTVAAVIGGRPADDDFRDYIMRFKGNPYVKGIRRILRSPEMLEAPGLVDGLRLLGELGMCFDLCMHPTMLAGATRLVDQCPRTRFVLDHCGNADPEAFRPDPRRQPQHSAEQWKRDLDTLSQRENVICKISGIVARADKTHWTAKDLAPIINYCLAAFGPDRVVFGGDWPVCTRVATLEEWIKALKSVVQNRPLAEQRKLFYDNAARFYGIG